MNSFSFPLPRFSLLKPQVTQESESLTHNDTLRIQAQKPHATRYAMVSSIVGNVLPFMVLHRLGHQRKWRRIHCWCFTEERRSRGKVKNHNQIRGDCNNLMNSFQEIFYRTEESHAQTKQPHMHAILKTEQSMCSTEKKREDREKGIPWTRNRACQKEQTSVHQHSTSFMPLFLSY